uniref:Calmin b n=1 Tax=Amphiprion percula TaxID=161767 RepID=A0A3P8TE36_AMPPE
MSKKSGHVFMLSRCCFLSPDERRAVQERTFTRWMNVFLQRHDPPVEVHDLFADIQDGRILMVLLEELSGCKLLYRFRSSSHRIFRLNNISKALAFLDDRHVSVFTWCLSLTLHFATIQVKEVTGGLQRHSSLSSLSVSSYPSSSDLSTSPDDAGSFSCSTLPSKGRKAAREPKYHGKAIKTLLLWVQRCTSKYGVEVNDFGKSWRSGLAFLALIKSINPGLVDLRESLSREPRENIQLAFMTAHQSLEIPPLLEPEDVMCSSPDEQSIIAYVSMFLGHHSTNELSSNKNKSRSQRVFQPPSPLDAGVSNQDIRLWLEKDSDQSYGKKRVDESRFSLSSEEGSYSMSALDSDEEDAYSYILNLNKEVSQPYNHPKRQVEKVEDETAEELNEESKHLEGQETFNGDECKHQEGYAEQNADSDLESEAGKQSLTHKKLDLDRNESSFREKSNYRDGFDLESERRSKEEEWRLVRGRSNDDGDCFKAEREEMENAQLEKDGCDKTQNDGVETKICEVGNWQKESEEGGEGELSEKWGRVSEWRRVQEEDEGEEGQGSGNEREEVEKSGGQNRANLESLEVGVKEEILTDHPESRSKNTEESDRRDNAVRMDSTKNCKDVEKTGDTEAEINSTDFEPVDGKEREVEIRRHRDLMITDPLGETTPKMDEVGDADVHDGVKTWTPVCSEASESFR